MLTGSHSHGQGHETTFAQLIAERIGVPISQVQIVHGDTDKVQFGMGTYGSRSIAVGGTAIIKAMEKVEAKGKKIAAHLLEASEGDIVIEDDGGEIEVTSAVGTGSTFTIYLPQAELPGPPVAIPAMPPATVSSGHGHRILVVEDNEDVGRFSTELLQDLGYATRRADNAKQALALIAADHGAFDLVFSDVIMPGMNGVELAVVIRERYPGLPVVLTSGYSSVLADNAHRGFELIQKPYSVEALSRMIRKAQKEGRWPGHLSPASAARVLIAILQGFSLQLAWDDTIDVPSFAVALRIMIEPPAAG